MDTETFDRTEFDKWGKLHDEIEALTFNQTHDPEEIKRRLQESPEFDVSGVDLDAEIYFALKCKSTSLYNPFEHGSDHFEMDHPEGRQEYIDECEAYQVTIDTLEEILGTLGASVDSSYFQKYPEGETFAKLRAHRSMLMGLDL